MEVAVARTDGDCDGVRCPPHPPRHRERNDDGVAAFYRTTPDVNPALRRGGLMSFFRKQRASRPV